MSTEAVAVVVVVRDATLTVPVAVVVWDATLAVPVVVLVRDATAAVPVAGVVRDETAAVPVAAVVRDETAAVPSCCETFGVAVATLVVVVALSLAFAVATTDGRNSNPSIAPKKIVAVAICLHVAVTHDPVEPMVVDGEEVVARFLGRRLVVVVVVAGLVDIVVAHGVPGGPVAVWKVAAHGWVVAVLGCGGGLVPWFGDVRVAVAVRGWLALGRPCFHGVAWRLGVVRSSACPHTWQSSAHSIHYIRTPECHIQS